MWKLIKIMKKSKNTRNRKNKSYYQNFSENSEYDLEIVCWECYEEYSHLPLNEEDKYCPQCGGILKRKKKN